jgi:hypothetical protein
MAKNHAQDTAMGYSIDYLEHLLKMEDVMEQHMERKISQMIDQKLRQYVESGRLTPKTEEANEKNDNTHHY